VLADQQSGDQVAADDEEEVDAEQSARNLGDARVVAEDSGHRDATKPVQRAEPA
jgi:hypothetical protein